MDDPALLQWFRRSRARPTGARAAEVGRPARHPDLATVEADLRALGIERRFRFVWSGDGSGVEEDDPEVIHIHRNLVDAEAAPAAARQRAERILALDIANVARHEVG